MYTYIVFSMRTYMFKSVSILNISTYLISVLLRRSCLSILFDIGVLIFQKFNFMKKKIFFREIEILLCIQFSWGRKSTIFLREIEKYISPKVMATK